MTKTGSIKTELANCREAWNNNKDAKYAWCCHHAIRFEALIEPFESRIAYILMDKPENERAIRLRNFRPVRIELPKELNEARAKYDKICAKYDKADDDLNKAYVEFNKVYDEWKACAEYYKDDAELINSNLHDQDWPDNTWNGKNIFGKD